MQSAIDFNPLPPLSRARDVQPPAAELLQPGSALARVEGHIPEWLRGTLLRTAPAVFEVGNWKAEHWFDGLGLLFSFEFLASGVRFSQRMMETEVARQARTGRVSIASFGSPSQRPWWRRMIEPVPRVTDNANVNVVCVDGQWIALTESSRQLTIDASQLSVSGQVAYDDALGASMLMLAHPQFDFERGQLVNLGVIMGPTTQVVAFAQNKGSQQRIEIGRIARREFPYLHSFGLTRDALVVVNHPLRARATSLLWSNRGFIDHFRWTPESGTELVVFDRNRPFESPRSFLTDPMFVFHTVNTFHEGGDLVLDVLAYSDPAVIDEFRTDGRSHRADATLPRLVRIRLHQDGRATQETLCDVGFEVPTIHYRQRSGKAYTRVWGSTLLGGPSSQVVAFDSESCAMRCFGLAGYQFGEPVFVPRPDGVQEDDGVLLSTGSSEKDAVLAVLAADTLEVRALVHVPTPVPLGFHGSFRFNH